MRLNGYIPLEELRNAMQPGHCYQLEMRVGNERWYVITCPSEVHLFKSDNEKRLHIDGTVYRLDCLGTFIGCDNQGYISDHIVSSVKELTSNEYKALDNDYGKMQAQLRKAEEKIRITFRQEIKL